MKVTVLRDRDCADHAELEVFLANFARALTCGSAVAVLTPSNEGYRHIRDADIVLFAAHIDGDGLDGAAVNTLGALKEGHLLEGKVAFPVLLGSGPSDFGPVYDVIAVALAECGATLQAPAFAVTIALQDRRLAVETYCKYWSPSIPALRLLARARVSSGAAA